MVWLVHLIGDVHQPLHVITRFSQNAPKGDSGGNNVHVWIDSTLSSKKEIHQNKKEHSLNLHAFWDYVLGTSNDPQDAIPAAQDLSSQDHWNKESKLKIDAWADEINIWVSEDFQLAQKSVY